MQPKLLKILVCPKCQEELNLESQQVEDDGNIITGTLKCAACGKEYKITGGIPRFVELDNYANSFGLQWNLFRSEQLDSQNGFKLSEKRFFDETGWSREWIAGKLILDVGCGAGRFLDVVANTEAEVVGVDLSHAVEAAQNNLAGRKNGHVVQASVYELPFRPETFDGAYCIGVVQHTPEPKKTVRAVADMIKAGGRVGFFIYERKPWTLLATKYLIRPVTKRLKNETLLGLIKGTMPVFFPLTEIAYRIPLVSKVSRFVIPISNYVGGNVRNNPGLTTKQRYQWAVMDTFDMLAPEYDEPQTFEEVEEVLKSAGIGNIQRTADSGLCLTGEKLEDKKSVI